MHLSVFGLLKCCDCEREEQRGAGRRREEEGGGERREEEGRCSELLTGR